jgi:intein/homing endonuclease
MGKLLRIEQMQNEDVYDISVRKNHNFFANEVLVHNCGRL